MTNKLHTALGYLDHQYYRLLLIVGNQSTGKTQLLQSFAEEVKQQVINLNLELSQRLLALTTRQRIFQIPSLLDEIISEAKKDQQNRLEGRNIVIFDNTEILFDRSLSQDPLQVLKAISRNQTVFCSWNGTLTKGNLTYADGNHPEFRKYDIDGIQVIDINTE